MQALIYRSVTDIVRPILKIVRPGEKGIGHSVRPKENWSSLFVQPDCTYVPKYVRPKSKDTAHSVSCVPCRYLSPVNVMFFYHRIAKSDQRVKKETERRRKVTSLIARE